MSSPRERVTLETLANRFVLHAIQDWGDAPAARIQAVQDVLDAAGLKTTATCWPVFGGIWPKPCDGPDGAVATAWRQTRMDPKPRGHFQEESAHVVQMIKARKEVRRDATPGQ